MMITMMALMMIVITMLLMMLMMVGGFTGVAVHMQNKLVNVVVVPRNSNNNNNSNNDVSSSSSSSSLKWYSNRQQQQQQPYSRFDAANIINNDLLPSNEYSNRIAMGTLIPTVIVRSTAAIPTKTITEPISMLQQEYLFNAKDPKLHETYGEFPLNSFDKLLDRAIELLFIQNQHIQHNDTNTITNTTRRELQQQEQKRQRVTIVDVGSGCGRLALYLALCSNSSSTSHSLSIDWDVHGIELSSKFHSVAVDAANRAVQRGWLVTRQNDELSFSASVEINNNNNTNDDDDDDDDYNNNSKNRNTLQFHLGTADKYQSTILANADIVFCYSTAFGNGGFSVNNSAMVLDKYWSTILSSSCCNAYNNFSNSNNNDNENSETLTMIKSPIIITTEKIIDPLHDITCSNTYNNDNGWNVVDRIDVPNPEVFESTGFIHQRKHRIW
jgi:hypothetical protein